MDSFPKCHICVQPFTLKGPVPYLLPCLHAVCETCVTSTAGGVISCSTCQREVSLTETHLQKDVVRQREIFHLTVQHRPSELLCTHEDDGNQAVCWCQECEEFLCEHCQNLHEGFKATRRHVVQDIGDIQPCSTDFEELCSTHQRCYVDFWDSSCKKLICAKCRLGDHAEHDVVEIKAAAETAKTRTESLKKEVQQVGDAHKTLLETTREKRRLTDETSNTIRDKISLTFHSLKTLQDQREKELHIKLQQHTDRSKALLDSKASNFQSNYLRCEVTADYLDKALLFCSKQDLLELKTTIEETSYSCVSSTQLKEQEDLPLPTLVTEGFEKMKSTMSTFGDISTMKELPSQTRSSYDKAIQAGDSYIANLEETEEQLRKHLERLTADLTAAQSNVEELQTVVKDVNRLKDETEADAADMVNVCATKSKDNYAKALSDKESLELEVSKHNRTITSLEADVRDYRRTAERLQTTLCELSQFLNSTRHILRTSTTPSDKSITLLCLQLKFDRDRVNINKVHINTEGELINKPDTRPHDHSKDRLVKYTGTTSTVPLPLCGSPQYWEMKARVGIDKTLTENDLLLEIGISVEEELDQHHCINGRPHSYSLTVSHCPIHTSICREVRKHGKYVLCLPDTLPNIPGQSTTLHYGVVFDDTRSMAVFMDVTNNKVISVLDGVDCSRPLWPMFGVYNPSRASVSMSLVVGNDIDMSEGKKAMILTSLLKKMSE